MVVGTVLLFLVWVLGCAHSVCSSYGIDYHLSDGSSTTESTGSVSTLETRAVVGLDFAALFVLDWLKRKVATAGLTAPLGKLTTC